MFLEHVVEVDRKLAKLTARCLVSSILIVGSLVRTITHDRTGMEHRLLHLPMIASSSGVCDVITFDPRQPIDFLSQI